MTNILVTGNMGYIGTIMTQLLNERSYRVYGLDSDLFRENYFFSIPENAKPYRQIIKDIRKISEDDLRNIDAVIHLAALSNDPLGDINTSLTKEINYAATVKLGRLSREAGVKLFIFASSCSIYGKTPIDTPIDETGSLNPLTAYARAKVDAEVGLTKLANKDFSPVFMRNATVYGPSPKLRLDLVVNDLLASAHLTGEITIMSDGTPWRPIVHIEDFCRAFMAALEAPAEKVRCQAFNVGINEENYRVKDIADEIQKILPSSKIKILSKSSRDERSYRVDFSKIKTVLTNFEPKWNLRTGTKQLLDAYKRYTLGMEDLRSHRYSRIKAINTLIEAEKIDGALFPVKETYDRRRASNTS